MRAATMKERPSFPLMRQTDVQTIYHITLARRCHSLFAISSFLVASYLFL